MSIGHPDVLQIHLSRDDSFEETSTPKEKLNSLLASRGVSHPLYNGIPWEEPAERTEQFHIRKARKAVIASLEEIAPYGA